jgi:hypothetical protein
VAWAGLAVITAPETTSPARNNLINPRIAFPSVTSTCGENELVDH